MAVAAGVVRDSLMPALVTLIPVAAQRCCPAQLDGTHGASLLRRHAGAMRLPVFCAVAAEDIRHFQRRPRHDYRLRIRGIGQRVQRAAGRTNSTGSNVRIQRCRLQAVMAEQHLNDPYIRPGFQ